MRTADKSAGLLLIHRREKTVAESTMLELNVVRAEGRWNDLDTALGYTESV